MRSLGFTGSRENGMPTVQQRYELYQMVHVSFRPIEVHHGDCINSDATFHEVCCTPGQKRPYIYVHPPDNPRYRAYCKGDATFDPLPYMKRNDVIVDLIDALIATPRGPEKLRSGTWATVRRARKKGIPIYIIWPDGSIGLEG